MAPQLRHPAAADRAPTTSSTPTTTSATRRCPPVELPLTECLADVVARLLPYWEDAIVPDLRAGRTVLVGAHGNSLRALVKHLDGISEDDIVELNIPTGEPLVYELGDDLRPLEAQAGRGALPAQRGGDPRGGRRGRPAGRRPLTGPIGR